MSEHGAITEMLGGLTWELPLAEDYKNDLVAPQFLGQPLPSNATAIVQQFPVPAETQVATEHWEKVACMVVREKCL